MLFLGCDTVKEIWGLDFQYINITLDKTDRLVYGKDGNGIYHIEYESNGIYYVRYETGPNKTVVWCISDITLVPVEWQGFNYEHPIISCSTDADDFGYGSQVYYLDETMIGDTLSIFGMLDSTSWSGLVIIVDDIVDKVSH